VKLFQVLPAALLFTAAAAQAALTHQYRLDGSLADDVGGVALTSSGGTLDAGGYTFGANQGLTLAANLGTVYTIDLSFHFDRYDGWQKIVDFANLGLDAGLYAMGNKITFCVYQPDPQGYGPDLLAGIDTRLTLTRDASEQLNIYSNGSLIASVSDGNARGSFGGDNANFFIDDLVTSPTEAAPGAVRYLRTYDTALSAQQVASLGAPVVPSVPEPGSVAMLVAGMIGMGAWVRRRRS
jgi:hypothetical protein